ncbi:MAG TPA: nitrate- and nitrite sensing domain-containing protein, partial [Acidimicrobiales bacterium]|nr:nitrate- and nitrite sensing domain-containing protein [Acidimicrobiales bacterium]
MKLAAALAVPLVALVCVTIFEVIQSARDVQRVREQTALAEASIGPVSLLSILENERNAAGVYLLGAEDAFALPVTDNAEARAETDSTLADFRAEVESQGGEIEAAYRPAIEAMGRIAELRAEVDAVPDADRGLGNIVAVRENFGGYTEVMDPFFEANKRVALTVDDPDLRRGAELVDLAAQQTNIIAILVGDLLLAQVGGESPDGVTTADELATIAGLLGQLRANEQLILTKATGEYRQFAEALFAAEEVQRFPEVVQQALDTGVVDVDGVMTYSAGDNPDTYGYSVFRGGVTEVLVDRADEIEAAATARQRWFVLLAATTVVVAGLVAWLVSRSITRPLRSLTRQAKDMAERRLPDAVIDILETPLG